MYLQLGKLLCFRYLHCVQVYELTSSTSNQFYFYRKTLLRYRFMHFLYMLNYKYLWYYSTKKARYLILERCCLRSLRYEELNNTNINTQSLLVEYFCCAHKFHLLQSMVNNVQYEIKYQMLLQLKKNYTECFFLV